MDRILTRHCPGCHREVRGRRKTCIFCGAVLPEAPEHARAREGEESEEAVVSSTILPSTLHCPVCNGLELVRVDFQTLTVHRCPQCRGIFLDGNTFDYMVQRATQRVLDQSAKGVRRRVQRGAPDSRLAYIPCPVCGQQMSRRNYARCSGVVFDQCLRDGVWLDDTELQQILTFITTGGHQLAKVIQEEAEQRLLLARQRAQSDALRSRRTMGTYAGWTLSRGLWNI